MDRREFLKTSAAAAAAASTSRLLRAQDARVKGPQPNILFILVDQFRFPSVFPNGITRVGEFLETYLPNIHRLWRHGVKFGNHHCAANACTPSRGVLITGLYGQQSWLVQTILSTPTSKRALQPSLKTAYPTYGKLLRAAGYKTPYIGKWHVSIVPNPPNLDAYGFDAMTWPDPTGSNLQGTYGDEKHGFHSDRYTTRQAVHWLGTPANVKASPWCLTVSLINPHDKEFFPAGTEFQHFTDLFEDRTTNPAQLGQFVPYPGNGPQVPYAEDQLKSPHSYGYPTTPPNWESRDDLIAHDKPSTQILGHDFQQGVWGGVTDDRDQNGFKVELYPKKRLKLGIAKAPFRYWQRSLDSYTQIMQVVDRQIGKLLDAFHSLPEDVIQNTVIVFASDHGETASAHGFVSGKLTTCYDEAWHVPLFVVDPSGRFTGNEEHVRTKLTSHVDLLRLLVSLGHNGSSDWIASHPELFKLYSQRHNMIPMLKSQNAAGRDFVLYSIDESAPAYYNFNGAPSHIIGMRTEESKLGLYIDWFPLTDRFNQKTKLLEYYDYDTPDGRLELVNTANRNNKAQADEMDELLETQVIPNELRAPLPARLRPFQTIAREEYLLYKEFLDHIPAGDWQKGALRDIVGFGAEF
jgi:arylsulfatase A-like enzyme